jgi:hypothetical protein
LKAAAVLQQLSITLSVTEGGVLEAVKELPPVELPEDFSCLTRTFDDLDAAARAYVLQRGVTPEQIAKYQIGVSFTGRYAYRVLFPVREGRVLRGIVARDYTGRQKPKYLNSPGGMALFGFDPEAETCVLSEGVFKALRLQRVQPWGTNSAAVLGHHLTEYKINQILKSKCRDLIFVPDPDLVGRQGVIRMIDDLYAQHWRGTAYVVRDVITPADEMSGEMLSNMVAEKYTFSSRNRLLK